MRSWVNENIQVLLPAADCDIVYVFVHFLNHFYKGGIGLRQVCDWCRLLWKYNATIDRGLLEKRLSSMGLIREWKAFGAFAVDYLGMPEDAMPLYGSSKSWRRKAKHICRFIIEVGNMGHNRDMSIYQSKHYIIRKALSFGRRMNDLLRHARIFPLNTVRFFSNIVFYGVRSAVNVE